MAMTLRVPGLEFSTDKAAAMRLLGPVFQDTAANLAPGRHLVTAEQTHGREIAMVEEIPAATLPVVDGLATGRPDLVLGIAVADCCPVWLWTENGAAFAVVHAGRKGAEAGIAAAAARLLAERTGSPLAQVHAFFGPCIRPPHYEVDIPALLHAQLEAAGAGVRHDCGLDTAAEPERFYSYRRESGATGRMMAFGWLRRREETCRAGQAGLL